MKPIGEYKREELIGQVVRLSSTTLVGNRDPLLRYKWYDYTFESNEISIQNAQLYANVYLITFLSFKNGLTSINIPITFEVEIVDPTEYKKLEKEYNKNNLITALRHSFIIGSDPEIFVEDDAGVVPAFEFLGSKDVSTVSKEDSQAVYWDGFQAEFTTYAQGCLDGVTTSTFNGLAAVNNAAKKYNKNAKLSAKTTIDIPAKYLESAKEEHVAFGCTPSLNIYNMKGTMMHGREVPFRSAGGHIHFGIGKQPTNTIVKAVSALDAILGVSCVSLYAKFDDPRRRSMYGLAGEYRLPPHGLEYRVLSNAWLFHPLLKHITFDLARKALMFGMKDLNDIWKADEQETIHTINNCDVAQARTIMKRNKELLIEIIGAAYGYTSKSEYPNMNFPTKVYEMYLNGAESFIANPLDIEGNWGSFKDPYTSVGNKRMNQAYRSFTESKIVKV